MTTPVGQYGGSSYQSSQVRALGSITPESYDYRDQGKLMSKLVNDVSYMAGMQRKMQEGIDAANQNVIQQLQGLINEIIVIFAGGGDTGFDFGDLKYIFQALGALFGLEPGNPLPINLFDAAWHFISTYLIPFSNFREAIDWFIDMAIATLLDIFGEIPILGQAIQQLAVLLSNLRDFAQTIGDKIDAVIDNIVAAFEKIPVVGPLIGKVWDTISGLLGIGENAQGSGDNANKAIAALEARVAGLGGAVIEDFSGTGPLVGYDIVSTGPGVNVYMKYDGDGNLGVNLAGASWRKTLGVYSANGLGTDDGIIKIVVKKKAVSDGIFSDPSWKYGIARANANLSEYVYVKWTWNQMYIGFALAGVEYDMGAAIPYTEKDGQLVELRFGVGGVPRRMKLFIDGLEKVDRTDTSGNMVTTNRGVGIGFHVNSKPFGLNDPGSMAILTGLDVA